MNDDEIIAHWRDCIRRAYLVARGTRLSDLRGERPKRFDARGLHPYSEECGRVLALQALVPGLQQLGFDPLLMRLEAEEDARAEFIAEVRAA